MAVSWERVLQRWLNAALIDSITAGRIRAYEDKEGQFDKLQGSILLVLAAGILMLAVGVFLSVAAQWNTLSPSARFALVLAMVASFHIAGALTAKHFESFTTTLHALGSMALGPGIFFTSRIFSVREHWPAGFLIWAAGVLIGWGLRRDWVHITLMALLIPAWVASEWMMATNDLEHGRRILTEGLILLAIAYFTARAPEKDGPIRRVLTWIGGLTLIPCTFLLLTSWSNTREFGTPSVNLQIVGWVVALGMPLALSVWLRRWRAWINSLAAAWVLILGMIASTPVSLLVYIWCAVGSIGLMLWGFYEPSSGRVNLGIAGLAVTVASLYYSNVMNKPGHSATLIGLGVLLLAGGWALERLRRRLSLL